MPSSPTLLIPGSQELAHVAPRRSEGDLLRRALAALDEAFGQPFVIVDVESGEVENAETAAWGWDCNGRLSVLAEAARRRQPEIVEHESPLAMLTVPLGGLGRGESLIAVSVFLTMPIDRPEEIASAAQVFGVATSRALAWARDAEPWSLRALARLAHATLENLIQRTQLDYFEREIHEAVAHARDTYAELGLLHRLTRGLTVSEDDGQLWRRAVQWLSESVPAHCLAIVPRWDDDSSLTTQPSPAQVIHGQCPVSAHQLTSIIEQLGTPGRRPVLLNRFHTSALTWGYPTIRELACTPIVDGANIAGWLLAINHNGAAGGGVCEFGSAEVRLL